MLDNLQVLPPEAFTATGKFGEKLLDKISNAIGWAAIPKNTKKYRLEAEEYLVEQIKNDDKIPVLAKAAYISNARKIIKQYVNKCDICTKAMNDLSTEADVSNIDTIEDDWLEFFFDRAKDIGKEDMQVVWARLLAKEIDTPNTVSKHLLHILTIISHKEALSFAKLANYCISVDGKDSIIIFYDLMNDFYKSNGLIEEEILYLEDIGLLQVSLNGFEYSLETDKKVTYFGKEIELGKTRKIYTGNVVLSRAGEELMSILTEREQINGYEEILKNRIVM